MIKASNIFLYNNMEVLRKDLTVKSLYPLYCGEKEGGAMHIKDIETRTGLSRANIRYYEQEGLVHPVRARNGYRDYSQEDLDTLLRVRLLRRLDVPIEEIRAMQAGELDLADVLEERIRIA